MMFYINQLFDEATLDALCDSLNDDSLFEDGKKTAGRTAKKVKNNLQGRGDDTVIKGARALLEKALRKHPIFNAAALPKQFAKIMFNRYSDGMHYGTHIDEPFIGGARTDLSFTLFLSDPGSYDGGELVLCEHDGDEEVKLPKGTLVLYPSTTLHHIKPVTRGQRLAAVGWVQSRVRSSEQRAVLFDLFHALAQLPDTADNQNARLSLLKARANLMRLWAE
ncbi:MAG: Fe2+-dependent dioxygenase [Gammaproteobacteria bacterium]|nr:MAG: Fe2+-dependent dioxygenase [Gammaproteobacteria bacterium]